MKVEELHYKELSGVLSPLRIKTGLEESAAFLVWFLRNVYRLDETDARDAVCDRKNDKGIDGIYVDHNNEEIHFLQAKIRQKVNGAIGDVGLKNLMASVQQFDEKSKIESILAGNADDELKKLITRTQLAERVADYRLVGVYVSNEASNDDTRAYNAITPDLRVYDRVEIASRIIDIDAQEGRKGSFTFDTSYVEPMSLSTGGADAESMYVFPARALQLVHMEGISDGSLFQNNVRYGLGNTSVNRSIRQSIADKSTHSDFVLFHNGIIILCSSVDSSGPDEITIEQYSVVNGAQSLTSFYDNKSKLTDDLRVLVRIIVVKDEALARTITENSNNQNAIKPRDLRSNHSIMVRLQKEMAALPDNYFFEVKRGEKAPNGSTVITNDEIGRALLSFDIREPWSAHQIYKVFDEKYSVIFGRPEVTADRIVFVYDLLRVIDEALPDVKNRPMASYTLTRYFLLYVLSRILRDNEVSRPHVADPATLKGELRVSLIEKCAEILKTVVVDLNYESNTTEFDYKSILKSHKQASELADRMLASYEKDVARGKAASFSDLSTDESA